MSDPSPSAPSLSRRRSGRAGPTAPILIGTALALAACGDATRIGSGLGLQAGDADEARLPDAGHQAVERGRGLGEIGPAEEYYIGRAVTASILSRYGLWRDDRATQYVNLLGQSIALRSDQPATYDGYRFILLDSDEVNAVAAPGGFVMVTRGMLERSGSEHALAAVLAHEIAHVQQRHGLRAIEDSRGRDVLLTIAAEVAGNRGERDVAFLTDSLSSLVDDLVDGLIESGYGPKVEFEADAVGLQLMTSAGYDPHGLLDILDELHRRPTPDIGWFRTHPAPRQRIARAQRLIESPRAASSPYRERRFRHALASLD